MWLCDCRLPPCSLFPPALAQEVKSGRCQDLTPSPSPTQSLCRVSPPFRHDSNVRAALLSTLSHVTQYDYLMTIQTNTSTSFNSDTHDSQDLFSLQVYPVMEPVTGSGSHPTQNCTMIYSSMLKMLCATLFRSWPQNKILCDTIEVDEHDPR